MTWLPRLKESSPDPLAERPFSLTDMRKWVSLVSLKMILNLNRINTKKLTIWKERNGRYG
jgi:hypothetical protein